MRIRDGIIAEVLFDRSGRPSRESGSLVVDCQGRVVLPGFIDCHCHLAAFAESLVSLDLSPRAGVGSVGDIQEKVAASCRGLLRGTWVRGKAYNEFSLVEKRHPNRHDLDAVCPDHPVKLTHRSGYAHVLNSLALAAVGITIETGDPPGGLIDRDVTTGEPTGVLYGMAAFLAGKVAGIGADEMRRAVRLADQALLSSGITSVQDATSHNDIDRWHALGDWRRSLLFRPRLAMMLGAPAFHRRADLVEDARAAGPHRVPLRGVKVIIHEITGSLHPTQAALNDLVAEIHGAGLQAVLHAVDESTVEAACEAIEYALARLPRPDHRHRIEHCSVCTPALVERLRRASIVVVTQPSFLYYEGDRYLATVPDKERAFLYAVGSMRRAGVRVAASSDLPLTGPNPFPAIYAAVTRRTESGAVVNAAEAIGRREAIGMYTHDAAFASFEERLKGTIAPGALGDLVVLNADPLSVALEELKELRVDMTILGGEVVWERAGATA